MTQVLPLKLPCISPYYECKQKHWCFTYAQHTYLSNANTVSGCYYSSFSLIRVFPHSCCSSPVSRCNRLQSVASESLLTTEAVNEQQLLKAAFHPQGNWETRGFIFISWLWHFKRIWEQDCMISDLKPLETHIQMKILEMACSEIKSEEGKQTRLFCLFHEGGTMLLITALSIHVYHR